MKTALLAAILIACLVFAIQPRDRYDGVAEPGSGHAQVLRVEAEPKALPERGHVTGIYATSTTSPLMITGGTSGTVFITSTNGAATTAVYPSFPLPTASVR